MRVKQSADAEPPVAQHWRWWVYSDSVPQSVCTASKAPAKGTQSFVRGAPPSPPHIDGLLDDPVWRQAIPAELRLQREPIEGAPATERTEVRVLFDDEQLYLALRCHDTEPERIVANLMRRDAELDENDYVMLVLDTYGDGRGGFFFATNPLGARWDMLLSDEGRSRNEAWDCIWSCRVNRDEWGWTAEMAIPFSQLRYPANDDAVWGINVGRTIRRKREEVFLLPPPRSYGFRGRYRTSRLAALTGLGSLKARTPLELSPYVLSGNLRDFEAIDSSDRYELEPGFDLKYGLTPGLMLDLSYRTDFAQVESDQEQVNLTRFSLFFPEKRDFFLEGAGIFDFGERIERRGGNFRPPTLLFYSRRIGLQDGENIPVIAGSKMTGRLGSFELGLLTMWTERETILNEEEVNHFRTDTGALLEKDDPQLDRAVVVDTVAVDRIDTSRVERTNFTVLRLRRDLLGASNIGLIATNRDPGGGIRLQSVPGCRFQPVSAGDPSESAGISRPHLDTGRGREGTRPPTRSRAPHHRYPDPAFLSRCARELQSGDRFRSARRCPAVQDRCTLSTAAGDRVDPPFLLWSPHRLSDGSGQRIANPQCRILRLCQPGRLEMGSACACATVSNAWTKASRYTRR